MDPQRIELGSLDCQPSIIPVYDGPAMDSSGIEPEPRRCERRVLPLNYEPNFIFRTVIFKNESIMRNKWKEHILRNKLTFKNKLK